MKDLKTNLLRFHQREQLQGEIKQAESMLAQAKPDERGTINASITRTKRQLESQSPGALTGKEKDTLYALEKKLRTRITTNMPSEEVMRKNPAGAVDWHQKWEKINKPLIRMWKNATIQLNPDSQDRDLSNIERFRPSGQTDRMRTDAQIPGLMSYGNVPDENWPFDPPQTTAAVQASKHYDESLAENDVNQALEDLDKVEDEEGVPGCSAEQRAILSERLAKGREVKRKKREEELQLQAALAGEPVEAGTVTV
jgi:hypothetical protein